MSVVLCAVTVCPCVFVYSSDCLLLCLFVGILYACVVISSVRPCVFECSCVVLSCD